MAIASWVGHVFEHRPFLSELGSAPLHLPGFTVILRRLVGRSRRDLSTVSA